MSISVTVTDDVATILERIARAQIQHPVTGTRALIGVPIVFEFSLGDDNETPTVVLRDGSTHMWPFEDEVTRTFDDRILGSV